MILTNGLVTVAIDRHRRHLLHRRHPGLRAAGRRAATTATPTTTRRRPSTRSSTRPTRWRSPPASAARSGPPPPSPPPSPGPTGWTSRPRRGWGATTVAVETTLEIRADEPVVRVRTQLRQPVAGPPAAGPPPPARAGGDLTGRVRLHHRRTRPDGRGPGRGVRHAHLPVPPVRVGRGADRGPRGPARVRAGRPRVDGGEPGTRAARAGPHPAAGDRHAVPAGHVHPSDDGRPDDAARGPPDDRTGRGRLRHRRRRRSIPTGWPTTFWSPGHHRVVRRGRPARPRARP